MKLKSYREILSMSKQAVDDTLAPLRAMKARKQAELEIAKMDERIASQEAKIHEICMKKELDFNALIAAQDELALMERRRKQFQRIIDELFPEA